MALKRICKMWCRKFNKLFYKPVINGLKKGFVNWILNMPNVCFTVYSICFLYIVKYVPQVILWKANK